MSDIIRGNQPYFSEKDVKKILGEIEIILKNGMLTQGDYLQEFESSFSKYIGSEFALGVNSGGTALEIALRALNIHDKEVIVPTDTFMATPNSVLLSGGTPVFVDIDKQTFAIDITDLKRKITDKTKGVILVHMFGIIPENIEEIFQVCKQKNLFLVEDAAHAHGSTYNGIKAGNIGDIGCFSFYATKVLTSGEGGAITTNNNKLNNLCKSIRNHGKSNSEGNFVRLGNNYRLSEIPSILAIYQTKRVEEFVSHRNKISEIYTNFLNDLDFVKIYRPARKTRYSYWRYPILVNKEFDRDQIQKEMNDKYGVRITWMYDPPCHLQPLYRDLYGYKEGDFPNAESILPKLLCLPTHMHVDSLKAKKIVRDLVELIEK